MQPRIAEPDDEGAVSAVLLASYTALLAKDYAPAVLAAALPRMVRANPALLAGGSFYVIDGPDGTVIGCGGWTRAAPGSGEQTASVGHLRHFATHPAEARRGIGRLIYNRCVAAARVAGITSLQAYSSLTAVPFYASVGLQRIRDFDLTLGGDIRFPAVLMEGGI